MSHPEDSPRPSETLSDELLQQFDSLSLPELKSVLSYVEDRIEALDTPFEAEIEATAAGEVINVEDHGAYALVRKHPPNEDGSGPNTEIVSQYHVRREPHMDGSERLHWTYIGDVDNVEEIRCSSCGGHVEKNAAVCPHCGTENTQHSGTQE